MCSSRKYPYPLRGGSLEIPGGEGSQKPEFLKENTKHNWDIFQRGGELKTKQTSVGGVWIVSGTTQLLSSQEESQITFQTKVHVVITLIAGLLVGSL